MTREVPNIPAETSHSHVRQNAASVLHTSPPSRQGLRGVETKCQSEQVDARDMPCCDGRCGVRVDSFSGLL